MEIYLILLLILFGGLCVFLTSIFLNLSPEKISAFLDLKLKYSNDLYKIKLNFQSYSNAYLIIEILFYTIGSSILIDYCISSSKSALVINNYTIYLWEFLAFFCIITLCRTAFFYIGSKFSTELAKPALFYFYLLTLFSKPIVVITNSIIKLFGSFEKEDFSRDELNALVETAREDGSLDDGEYRILKNIMHFSEVYASDVMTPRTVIFSLNADKTVADVVELNEIQMYSRIPIWEGSSIDDGVVGYVMSKDIIREALHNNNQTKLRKLAHEVYFIPENAELDKALDKFLQRRQHLFLVVDEYGGIEGLLSMEDVIETILGAEIVDEADKVVDLRELAKQRRDKRIASTQNSI